jgi:hypothetical protein
MCLFKKKKAKIDAILDSKVTIGKNAADLAVIVSKLSEHHVDLAQKCAVIHDELKYLSPSKNPEIHKIDQTIHQRIDDLKIEVNQHLKDDRKGSLLSVMESLKALVVLRSEESKRFKR